MEVIFSNIRINFYFLEILVHSISARFDNIDGNLVLNNVKFDLLKYQLVM